MAKGLFITFEGPDFCGKDTHWKIVDEHLFWRGYPVVSVRDPGSTKLGEVLRELLMIGHAGPRPAPSLSLKSLIAVIGRHETLQPDGSVKVSSLLDAEFEGKASVRTESLVFLAAHAQLAGQRILPALRGGKIVLGNRYTDSSFAYQGYGRGENLEWLRKVTPMSTENLVPDLTFLLDIPVEEMARRSVARGILDRIEKAGPAFYDRVRRGYLELAKLEPERWVVIDGTRPVEENRKAILAVVEEKVREVGIEPSRELLWGWGRGKERGV